MKKFCLILVSWIVVTNSFAQKTSQELSSVFDESENQDMIQTILTKYPDLQIEMREDGKVVFKITLEQALWIAQKYSSNIELSQYALQIKQSAWMKEQNSRYGVVEFSTGFSHQLQQGKPTPQNQYNFNKSQTQSGGAKYTKKLDSGLSYQLDYKSQKIRQRPITAKDSDSDPSLGGYSDWKHGDSIDASLNIPLSQDLGEVNQVKERISGIDVKKAQIDLEASELQILKLIADQYWDFLKILKRIEVQQSALELSEKMFDEMQQKFQLGQVEEYDVLNAEWNVLSDREKLFDLEIQRENAQATVLAALNPNFRNLFIFEPIATPAETLSQFDETDALEKVKKYDQQLQKWDQSIAQEHLKLIQIQNKDKFDLDLTLGTKFTGLREMPLESTQDMGRDELFDPYIKLTWKIPFSGDSIAEDYNQNRLAVSRLTLEKRNRAKQIEVEVKSILASLQLQEKRIQANQYSLSLAKKQLDKQIQFFRMGRISSLILDQTRQKHLKAQETKIASKVLYEKTRIRLLVSTRDLYDFYSLTPLTP